MAGQRPRDWQLRVVRIADRALKSTDSMGLTHVGDWMPPEVWVGGTLRTVAPMHGAESLLQEGEEPTCASV